MAQVTLDQILDQLDTLEPEELERLTQAISQRLSQQKSIQQVAELIPADQDCPVWSPYDAFEAAEIMLKALQDAKSQDHG